MDINCESISMYWTDYVSKGDSDVESVTGSSRDIYADGDEEILFVVLAVNNDDFNSSSISTSIVTPSISK